MGHSASAITFYGYIWTEEDPGIDFDLSGAVRATIKERGVPDPWTDRPANVPHRNWADAHRSEIDAWRATMQATDAEFPIDVGWHGSDSWSMPYVFIRSTETTAGWGDPKPLTSLEVDPAWRELLEAFMADQGIDPPEGENQPGWWSAAYYG